MAMICFLDFDMDNTFNGNGLTAVSWTTWAKPPGVFRLTGVVAQNNTVDPGTFTLVTGRTIGKAVGNVVATGYTSTTMNANGGMIVGVNRSTIGIGSEIFCSFDVIWNSTPIVSTTYGNATTYSQPNVVALWRWGDLGVWFKTGTLISTTYTIVFSIKNGGVEVATVSLPGVTFGYISSSFIKISAKLDATVGYISMSVDGVNQSVVYTGSNTVSTTSLASTGTTSSADHVFFGPLTGFQTAGNNFTCNPIDNVYIDDTALPLHRPNVRALSPSGSGTLSGWSAVGTGATTIGAALVNSNDVTAARGNSVSSSALIPFTSISTSSLEPNVLGFVVVARRIASRDANNLNRQLSYGLSVGGVHTMDTVLPTLSLPVSLVSTPPNTDYISSSYVRFDGLGVTTASLNNVNFRLLTS